jgi:hypothetical protein
MTRAVLGDETFATEWHAVRRDIERDMEGTCHATLNVRTFSNARASARHGPIPMTPQAAKLLALFDQNGVPTDGALAAISGAYLSDW